MADKADIAGDYLESITAEAIARRVRYQGESATHCLECGEEIPLRRRELVPGVQHCVACQAEHEALPPRW